MTNQINILKEVINSNKEGFTMDFKGKLVSKDKGYFIGITNIKAKILIYCFRRSYTSNLKGLGRWMTY